MSEKHRGLKMDLLLSFGKLKRPLKTQKQVKHVKKTFLTNLQKTKNIIPDSLMMRSINAFIRINLMEKRVPRFIGSNVKAQKLYQKAVKIMSLVSKTHGRNCGNVKCKAKDEKNKTERQKLCQRVQELLDEVQEKTIECQRMKHACEQAREQIPADDNPVVRDLQGQLDIEKQRNRHLEQRMRRSIRSNRVTNDSVMRVLESATALAEERAAGAQKAIEASIRRREAAMVLLRSNEIDLEDHDANRIIMQQKINHLNMVIGAHFPRYQRSRPPLPGNGN